MTYQQTPNQEDKRSNSPDQGQGKVARPKSTAFTDLPTGYLPATQMQTPNGAIEVQRSNSPQPPRPPQSTMPSVPPTPPAAVQTLAPGTPNPASNPGVQSAPQPPPQQAYAGPVGRVTLFRGQHFYVTTTIHPNKRPLKDPLRKPSGTTTYLPKVNLEQEERVASNETRMMPSIDIPDDQPKKKRFPIPNWIEMAVVFVGLAVCLVAHYYNMFNYPRYELDEGTYMSSAWSIWQGKLWPYAYGYGHPPFAWMQIAGLIPMMGGWFTFGNAINTGRVIMLLYALGSTLLTYLVVRRMGGSRSAGLLAMVIFSLSPLGIAYQRQVLLDNIATFWLLLALFLISTSKSRLHYLVLGGLAFAGALLSKEVLVLFIPGIIYAVWLHTTKFQRKFALMAFIYTFLALFSSWVLMALLKGEFFPDKTGPFHLPWDTANHLSMMQTFMQQAKRGSNEGGLAASWKNWFQGDPLLMTASVVTLGFNLIAGWWNRKQLLFAILGISFWLLLVRGGVVLSFYLIPLIPIAAINAALMVNTVMGWIGKLTRVDLIRAMLVLATVAGVIYFDVSHSGPVYISDTTKVQVDTINWVRANIPRNSYVVMNSYLYMDMKVPGGAAVGDGATYPFADVYINIATDPELYKVMSNNWDRVDYIIADSEVRDYIKTLKGDPNAGFLYEALYGTDASGRPRSILRASFQTAKGDQPFDIQIYEVIHKFQPPVVSTPFKDGTPVSGGALALASTTLPQERWTRTQ